ncbi:MAG: glycosyltransferase [Gemmataceae bacterium]
MGARILIVTGIFPPDAGGPASYVPTLATALSRRGHHIDVVTLSDRLDHDDHAWPFRVHRLRRRLFWPWRILLTIFTIWRLARGKDVVYVNGLGSEAALGARLAGRPTVFKIVGDHAWERARSRGWFTGTIDEFQTARKGLRLRLLSFIRACPVRGARRVIVPSDYLRHIVTGWNVAPEKVSVVYNAPASRPAKEIARSAPTVATFDGTTLITVCRLVPWKGVDALIRIVAATPKTRLLIVGDGALRAKLEELAASSGVSDRVLFLGQVPGAEVRPLLEQADVFVLNSTYEGLPHVVLEAMEAGIPVVASDAGGTSEVVQHEITGLLVPVGDDAALAHALSRLRGDAALARRLVAGARLRLETHLSHDAMIRQTEAILLAEGAAGGLSVLSLGFTRGLWEGEGAEDYQRLLSYGAHLQRYVLVTNSYKRHHLKPRRLGHNVEAIPTDGFSPVDGLMRMFWLGARAMRRRRTSLIQAQDPFYSGLPAALLAGLFRVPLVVCVYGPNVYDRQWLRSHWSHRLLAPVGRWVMGQARCLQVDGRLTARSLIAAGHRPERIAVKPLVPTNLGRFLDVERRGATDGTAPRFLFAGRLAPQKNLPLLLRAAKEARARGCGFELLLAGSGPEEGRLRRACQRAGLLDCVRFVGEVSRADIVRVFAEADVFILSSDYEGYPRVLMEAAAAALPVITTAVSGADEAVIDGATGFIVPVGQVEPLVARMTQLAADSGLRLRMGSAGRRHIATQLDPATNAPRQLAIWHKVAQ